MSFLYYATLAQVYRLDMNQHQQEIKDLFECLRQLKQHNLHKV
jgi:hypothetical protein